MTLIPSPVETAPSTNRIWPRSTSLFLVLVGLALAVTSFIAVMSMPELPWHSTRDAELRSTYDAFRDTGILLATEAAAVPGGTGAPSDSPVSSTAWDVGPGSYIVASLMAHVTGSDSPYPGLSIVQALLISAPLIWLPTAVARIFRRARAGYALALLPALMWLVNNGTVLTGTAYGLSDEISPVRVYALYGIAAAVVFLSLALCLLFSTYRLSPGALIAASLAIVVLAGFGNLFRPSSGVGVAAAVGVLWWLNGTRRWRWLRAITAAGMAIALAFGIQTTVMGAVDAGRSAATGLALEAVPSGHGVWHSLYLGLSYPEPVTGQPSTFGIPWSDEYAWQTAGEGDPDGIDAGARDDLVLQDRYLQAVASDPSGALGTYVQKLLFVVKHFGAMIIFVIVGFVLALTRRVPQRRSLKAALAIALPTLLLGLAAPVLVMPLLYYYSELMPALGLLSAVALGAVVWSLTSMPSHVRAVERTRLSARARLLPATGPISPGRGVSAIVPTRNGEDVIVQTATALAGVLSADDEVIVVENGSSDSTQEVLEQLAMTWDSPSRLVVVHSAPGLGEALRAGVLASTGRRLLLTADDLPFGFTDLEGFRLLPDDVVVAIGSKAHPASDVTRSWRRTVQSRIFRFLREALLQSRVGDSQGTIWVDGVWARAFAHLSRETGLMWTTELVLAAEQQHLIVREVPVTLSEAHETGTSRFRFADAWQSVVGFTRLAVYKDDYCNEDWIRSTHRNEEPAIVGS
ncbi:glycosyltransferase [Microbacterium atlanticum]|uniref:glycosyltransferase n=1 Tax=Microbacterium atlanticum TaxID=2782168 RepID=UPI001888B192|nr:glycosyltransferase [Microbacterium atlanticum]